MGSRTLAVLLASAGLLGQAPQDRLETLNIRGRDQTLRLYGPRGADPVIVASGDGGWIHLGPRAAEALADRGYSVTGFDSRAYLSGFTTRTGTLTAADVQRDFRTMVDYVRHGDPVRKVVLVGVSEGAGLAVLASTDPQTRAALRGVVALGLPERNELAWRLRDSIIYLTKKVPREPTFSVANIIAKVSPLPLAAIHSTHDDFAPLEGAKRLLSLAAEPKRLWVVEAADHRFSDDRGELERKLGEAMEWLGSER